MKQIIIADDHAVVRTGLQLIFDTTPDIELAKECSNGNELLNELNEHNYDAVLLDISMPGKDAFSVLECIKASRPSLPVVIFTMNNEVSYATRMFKKGADAFINKEADPLVLIEAIRMVVQGKKYYTDKQREKIVDRFSHSAPTRAELHEHLSDREFQIMCMLATGMKKGEIADNLFISKNTVNNHRNNIMKKMQFSSTSELTRYALEHNFIV